MFRTLFALLLFSCPLMASSKLCGSADARVCLQNGLNLSITGIYQLEPGTAIVMLLPGMETLSSSAVQGNPTVTYRFDPEGVVSDGQGGAWKVRTLAEDADGITALSLVLDEGVLTDPVSLQIQEVTVCQYVSDGPAQVTLGFETWVTTTQARQTRAKKTSFNGNGFELCPDFAGSLPFLGQDYRLMISNPHEEPVAAYVGETRHLLEPGTALSLEASQAYAFAPGMALPAVFLADGTDLSVTGFDSKSRRRSFIPHLARDPQWENRWIFANQTRVLLDWRQGSASFSKSYAAGIHEVRIAPDPDLDPGQASLSGSAGFNGFFQFSRHEAPGSAWVNGLEDSTGSTLLYLPHVAADTASFWTGYSLANPNEETANVEMNAYDVHGQLLAVETFLIPAGSNEIGLVGSTRLQGIDGISWIAFLSDQPLAGLELVGENRSQIDFAGFLLPDQTSGHLAFPLLKTQDNQWSGLAMLNPTALDARGTLLWLDHAGTIVQRQSLALGAGVKFVAQAPVGSEHAIWKGDPLVGFCLVGEHGTGKIGGYCGLPVPGD